jgi:hypothetical protein
MAFVAGLSGQGLLVYRFGTLGDKDGVEGCYVYSQPAQRFSSPSLAPDAQSAVWAEGDGIWRADIGNVADGCESSAPGSRMLIPGGESPDWGPADVPPERTATDGPAQSPAGPTGPTGPTPDGPTGPTGPATLSAGKVKLRRALAKGFVVRVGNVTGTVKLTARISAATAKRAKLGRKAITVASGSGQAGAGGEAQVRLRFTKRAARALKRLRSVKLTVAVAGGDARKTVTLRR